MSHKFLSIVRVIEMEIPPANVLLFLETRNRIVCQFPTFMFILFSKIDNGVYISISLFVNKINIKDKSGKMSHDMITCF